MKAASASALRLWRMPLLIWLALLVLLALTVGSAFFPLGLFNALINIVIAAMKVALVMLFFMKLRSGSALLRLAALAGIFWLMFLFVLTATDYMTRQ
jgi:cytochrome c oxidase subunit 4